MKRTRYVTVKGADRSPGDCLRLSVALAYNVPYNETPNPEVGGDPGAFWDAWFSWAPTRGLEWWKSSEFAPTGFPCWIAGVDQPGQDGNAPRCGYHAVPMTYDRLLIDPARWQAPGDYYREIALSDVRHALALLPAGTGDLPAGVLSRLTDGRRAPWAPPLKVRRIVRLVTDPRLKATP